MRIDPKEQRTVARAMAIGLELGGAVIICLIPGSWADKKPDTAPWLTLVGLLLGTVAGLAAVIRMAKATKDPG